MPKPFLHPDDARLESDIIETMLAGLKEWRPDLSYPESHSDMQGCVRALFRMFEIKRRPLSGKLRLLCSYCDGHKNMYRMDQGVRVITICEYCQGRGWKYEGDN